MAYAWLPRIVYGCGHVLHSALCFFQSPFWHFREQYRACMHLWQRFNLTPIDARYMSWMYRYDGDVRRPQKKRRHVA